MTETLEKLEALAKLRAEATPTNWEAIEDGRFESVRTVDKIVKNDPGNYPETFAQEILEDGPYDTKSGDLRFIAAAGSTDFDALLAHHRQLIERVEVLEGEKERLSRDKFDAGYLLATANIVHLHGEDTLAEDVLKEHNACDAKTIKRLNLTDYDAKVLRPLFREIDRKAKLPPRKALGANS